MCSNISMEITRSFLPQNSSLGRSKEFISPAMQYPRLEIVCYSVNNFVEEHSLFYSNAKQLFTNSNALVLDCRTVSRQHKTQINGNYREKIDVCSKLRENAVNDNVTCVYADVFIPSLRCTAKNKYFLRMTVRDRRYLAIGEFRCQVN